MIAPVIAPVIALVIALVIAVVIAATLVGIVGVAPASPDAGGRTAHSPAAATRAAWNDTIEPSAPATAKATAAERNERLTEATRNDRRHSSRDGRPLDWLAVAGLVAVAVTALASSIARRRHRRIPITAFEFARSRAPPLLLPS